MTLIEELDEDGNVIGEEGEAEEEEEEEEDPEVKARIEADEKKERERVETQFAAGEEFRQDGNKLMGEGDLKRAIKSYEKAKQELTMVGNTDDARRRAEQANLALHLNVALANLKLENYNEVKTDCMSALVIEPKNVKALFRRGMAQASLARKASLFQEAEAKAACEDFEALLEVEPGSAQAEKELHRLRSELKANARELQEKQKQTWKGIYGPRTDTGEEEMPDVALPAVRPCKIAKNTEKRLLLSLEEVCVQNQCSKAILSDVSLELREGWCIGLSGKDLPAAVALVQVTQGKATLTSGRAIVHEKKRRAGRRNDTEPMPVSTLAGAVGLMLALLVAFELGGLSSLQVWAVRVVASLVILAFVALYRQSRTQMTVDVALATWKPYVNLGLDTEKTLEHLLGSLLPRQINTEEKQEKVDAMLLAAGISGDGGGAPRSKKFRTLPQHEQRIVHVLRCIIRRPELLVLEDPLQGLPIESQARLLRMLKRMKSQTHQGILFFSPDLDQVSYLADSLGLLEDGMLCEKGPAEEVLAMPRHPQMQAYIASHLQSTGENKVGGKVHAKCAELFSDAALDANWVPPKYT